MMKANLNKILGIIVIILFLLLAGVSTYTYNLNAKYEISNQNVKALNDSIRITENKLGDIEAAKQVLVSSKKELDKLNKELAAELDKEKGRVYNLTQLVAKLKNIPKDTIIIYDEITHYANGDYGIKWSNDTIYNKYNFRKLSGETFFKVVDATVIKLNTKLYNDELGFNLVTGLRKLDGKIEIFVRSDYPGFNITKLDGAIIDPHKDPLLKEFTKKKKWVVGPGIFIGLSGEGKLVPILGGGITYNLFSF